jgi:hypothetical protein
MTKDLRMFGEVRQRIIDLAEQQVLTVIQACDRVTFRSHRTFSYPFQLWSIYGLSRKTECENYPPE